ncbi:MAG: chemotaxis protein CheW [Rhodospirillaceae bacterium]
MDDLLKEFLTETAESIESLDVELVKLEQNPNDPELIGNIFRLVHTIKGTCGFLGLPRLESVAHAGENVLGRFRDGTLEVTPEAVTLILAALDRIKSLLAALEERETEPEGEDAALIAQLDEMAARDSNTVAKAAAPAPPPAAPAPAAAAAHAPAAAAAPVAAAPAAPAIDPAATLLDNAGGVSSVDCAVELMLRKADKDPGIAPFFKGADLTVLQGRQVEYLVKVLGGAAKAATEELRAAYRPLIANGFRPAHFDRLAVHLGEALKDLEVAETIVPDIVAVFAAVRDEAVEPPPAAAADHAGEAKAADDRGDGQSKESGVAQASIRVSVDLLENLMTMVSELVLTRNQLLQMVRKYEDSEFKVPLQRLSHVTTDLQEGVMKTRMQPIGNAWAKLPRIIRDLSRELGKKIDLQMIGAETELDRQVLELIKDPLTHMVRNSADHGLETPDERVSAGKQPTGKIVLNAYHEGGHIIIEISDDGRGINLKKVKAKIVSNGLASESELEAMSEQQIQQFIFKAGFSTAEKVTSVSGRGVGMDVVRTNIEKIGGNIELRSVQGKGSTFVIKIPLTLAIVSALIVECGGERFAIPQISVDELVRVSGASEHRIEVINETPVLRLRDRLLPLVDLGELLRISDRRDFRKAGGEATDTETLIIVAKVGTQNFGIIVDRVFDTEEIVVKPVSPILRAISIYSGNTILGDGSVVMILDPNGIAAASGEIAMADERADEAKVRDGAEGERVACLVFRAGSDTPKAVPLALVARLEEIARDTIEFSNGRPVVQYRGQIMPLLAVDPAFALPESGRQPVVVFTDHNRSMGLMVDEITDIIEDRVNIELTSATPGILGSTVLAGRTTDMLDTSYYASQAFADWFGSVANANGAGDGKSRVLLVDDSAFFRNLLAPLLSVAGYEVTPVESASDALALREAGENYDVIISDIEMPGMDGFRFAEEVRQSGQWQKVPMVALSSRTAPGDLQRGREVGFSDYVPKLDRDALLATLSQTISQVGVAMKGAA